jgi:hypothetical protein
MYIIELRDEDFQLGRIIELVELVMFDYFFQHRVVDQEDE